MDKIAIALSEDFQQAFDEVKREYIWLYCKWKIYNQLYVNSEKRIELLNETAKNFFFIVQKVLLDDIQLSLCKITEPAQTFGHQNLTLEQLLSQIDFRDSDSNKKSLKSILKEIKKAYEVFKERRDKKLVHYDYKMQILKKPLPTLQYNMIKDTLDKISRFLNHIENSLRGYPTEYENVITEPDGESLIFWLKCGKRYNELVNDEKSNFDDLTHCKFNDA